MKSYQVAEIVKTFAPAGLRDDEAKPVPVAQTAWLDTYDSTDFLLRETFWQIALLPIDVQASTRCGRTRIILLRRLSPRCQIHSCKSGHIVPCLPALLVSTGSVAGVARLARLPNRGT